MQCFCTARQLSTDLEKSRDLLQTGGFTSGDKVTHFVFVVTAFSVVACRVLLHICSFLSHQSLRTSSGRDYLDVVSEKHSILARSVFVLHGHRFCRDIVVVLIASIVIWILDILLYLMFIWKLEIYGI